MYIFTKISILPQIMKIGLHVFKWIHSNHKIVNVSKLKYICRITSVLKVETDITSYLISQQVPQCQDFQSWHYCFYLHCHNVLWRHTDKLFSVSASVCWYCQYYFVRSKQKYPNYWYFSILTKKSNTLRPNISKAIHIWPW